MFTINLDGGTVNPLINDEFWSNLTRILNKCGFVFDRRRSIDLLTNILEKLQKYYCWSKPLKLVVLLLTATA